MRFATHWKGCPVLIRVIFVGQVHHEAERLMVLCRKALDESILSHAVTATSKQHISIHKLSIYKSNQIKFIIRP